MVARSFNYDRAVETALANIERQQRADDQQETRVLPNKSSQMARRAELREQREQEAPQRLEAAQAEARRLQALWDLNAKWQARRREALAVHEANYIAERDANRAKRAEKEVKLARQKARESAGFARTLVIRDA